MLERCWYIFIFSPKFTHDRNAGGHIKRTPSNKEPDEKKSNGRGERMKQGCSRDSANNQIATPVYRKALRFVMILIEHESDGSNNIPSGSSLTPSRVYELTYWWVTNQIQWSQEILEETWSKNTWIFFTQYRVKNFTLNIGISNHSSRMVWCVIQPDRTTLQNAKQSKIYWLIAKHGKSFN